jgi:hypothetical protein
MSPTKRAALAAAVAALTGSAGLTQESATTPKFQDRPNFAFGCHPKDGATKLPTYEIKIFLPSSSISGDQPARGSITKFAGVTGVPDTFSMDGTLIKTMMLGTPENALFLFGLNVSSPVGGSAAPFRMQTEYNGSIKQNPDRSRTIKIGPAHSALLVVTQSGEQIIKSECDDITGMSRTVPAERGQ